MQSLPLGSVDLLTTGPPANAAAAKTGQNGVFAAHLAAASQEKAPTAQQQEGKSSTQESSPSARPLHDSESDPINNDSADDHSLDGTLNGSAGAANAAIIPVPISTDAGSNPNQSRVPTVGRDSIVSEMLNALTSGTDTTKTATDDTKAAVQTNNPATQAEGLTNPSIIASEQPGGPTLPVSGISSSGGGGIIAIDNTALQPQIIGSIVPDTAPIPEVTIATASAAVTSQAQPADPQTAGQQETAQKGSDQIVQNKYGQIITIHQSSEAEEMAATMVTTGATATTATSHLNLDINNNYIHSHLPNEAPAPAGTTEKKSDGQPQDSAQDNQQKEANTAKNILAGQLQPEQAASQKFQISVGQDSQPLLFAHHQQASSSLTASTDSTSSTASSMLRLPSGLTVPEGTVVDQMIAHFSVNKQLEASTVNIKLYPQELGELRMEIKVSQDNIKAHIIAQNPQAEEMINRHLPRLREALEQQGLHLQQIDVTVATQDNTGGERYQEHASQQQLNRSLHNRSSQPVFSLDTGEETEEASSNLSVLA